MNKIVLLENTIVLKNRIESILNNTGHNQVDTYSKSNYNIVSKNVIFNNAHLVIVDIDNFNNNTDDIVKEIRSTQFSKNIPIVLVTDKVDTNFIIKASKYGQVEILLKPFTDTKLLEKTLWNSPAPTIENIIIKKDVVKESISLLWREEFMIGIKEIDDEHKMIVDNFRKLYDLMHSGKGHEYYKELLSFLEYYIDEHFSHEEAYHEKAAYNLKDEHVEYHRKFTDKIRNLIEHHKEKEVTNMDVIQLNLFIKQWLLHHILVEDKKFGNFINPDQ